MTSTGKRDLTSEFRANRFAQITNISDRAAELEAAVQRGELRKISGGRFQVVRSDTGMGAWDAGEILSEQGMPEHGLDLSVSGEARFMAIGDRPWHALGKFFTREEAPHTARGAAIVSGQDWEVLKRRVRYLVQDEDADGNLIENPDPADLRMGEDDMFVSMRSDTKKALGQVGKIWTPIHNADGFAFMEEFGEPFETMGSFRNGRRVFATMRLPETMTVDAAGVSETIQLYVAAINNHTGNGGLNLYVTPYRIECGNTERMAVKGAITHWVIKHTKNHQEKLAEAQKSLRLVHRYAEAWTRDENALAQTAITDKEIASIVADIWDVDPEDDGVRKQKKAEARMLDIMDRWAVERERCGTTAYAFERALTGHADHAGERRPRSDSKALSPLALLGQSLLENTGAKLKDKVHGRMMALVRK